MKYSQKQIFKLRKFLTDRVSKSSVVQDSCCLENQMVQFVESVSAEKLIFWAKQQGLNLDNL